MLDALHTIFNGTPDATCVVDMGHRVSPEIGGSLGRHTYFLREELRHFQRVGN
jgi:hypothetical protein